MAPTAPPAVFLRNYLSDTQGGKDAPKSLAFVNIIPQFNRKTDVSTLVDSYQSFIDMTVIPALDNNVYIRGVTSSTAKAGNEAVFTLRAVPSELILWPQLWTGADILNPGPIVVDAGKPGEKVAASAPFTFRPQALGGVGYALISSVSPKPPTTAGVRLRDSLPELPSDKPNWRDLWTFIKNDKTTAFSNVVVASTTAPKISVSTGLHFYEDDPNAGALDQLIFTVTASSMDPKTEFAFSDDKGLISAPQMALNQGGMGVSATLPDGYASTITFNVYPSGPVSNYAWISLQVSASLPASQRNGGLSTSVLLGSLNVVFNSDLADNVRFASADHQTARKTASDATMLLADEVGAPAAAGGGPQPANGWWFRDTLGDTNSFPRAQGIYSMSPDIQPVGMSPDNNIVADVGSATTAAVDYTAKSNVVVQQNSPNYIYYLRGYSSQANYTIQSRLFAVPNSVLISPSQYTQVGATITDTADDGAKITAVRSITTGSDTTAINVFTDPFVAYTFPPLIQGSDHYCLIAETRQITAASPDPNWPHEVAGDFATADQFASWVGSTANVAWRNISVSTDGGSDKLFQSIVDISAAYTANPNQAFTLLVLAKNASTAHQWQLTCDSPALAGQNIGFPKANVPNASGVAGVHFAGLPVSLPYHMRIYLQYWTNNAPTNGLSISFQLQLATDQSSPMSRLAMPLPEDAHTWPMLIGEHHPSLVHRKLGDAAPPLPPLVPHFNKPGWQDEDAKSMLGRAITPTIATCIGGDSFKWVPSA